jgi:F-type H+-transporting ATPase subunit delta
MNRGPIVERYAKALFDLGQEQGQLEQLYNSTRLFVKHCNEVEDFCSFLNSPIIKPSKKKEVLKNIFAKEQHPLMIKFISIVIDKNREKLLYDMLLYFEGLYKKSKGIKSIILTTAFAMDKTYIEQLHNFMEREFNATVELQTQVKPQILGGMILVVDNKIVDNSIAHQMKLIKKKLLS